MAAGLARRLDHRLGRDARRPPAGAVRRLCTGLLLPAAAAPSPVGWRCGAARLQALLLPARQRRTQGPGDRRVCSASSLSGSRRWAGHAAGLRHRRLAHQAVRAALEGAGSITTPLRTGRVPVPLRPRLGLSGPPGPTLALGSDRPADPLALVHPSQDVGWMAAYYGWQFHTKLELAAAQIEWLVQQLGPDHPPIWVVPTGLTSSGRS